MARYSIYGFVVIISLRQLFFLSNLVLPSTKDLENKTPPRLLSNLALPKAKYLENKTHNRPNSIDKRLHSSFYTNLTLSHFHKRKSCDLGYFVARFDPSQLQLNCDNLEEVEIEKKLGEGAARVVYVGTWRGKKVAVKVGKSSEYELENIRYVSQEAVEEAAVYYHLPDSPSIAKMIGVCNRTFVLELGVRDMLSEVWNRTYQRTIEDNIRDARDIARGLRLFHEIEGGPVVNGDMKLQNFVRMPDGHIAFADLNLVAYTGMPSRGNTKCLSRQQLSPCSKNFCSRYKSPEEQGIGSYTESGLTERSEMFSFGRIMWSLQAKSRPFEEFTREEIFKLLLRGARPSLKAVSGYPHEALELISKCWEEDPLKRPTAKEAVDILDQILARMVNKERNDS